MEEKLKEMDRIALDSLGTETDNDYEVPDNTNSNYNPIPNRAEVLIEIPHKIKLALSSDLTPVEYLLDYTEELLDKLNICKTIKPIRRRYIR